MDPETPLFDPESDPFMDVDAALTRARAEHKNVLIDVGGDWCVWCRRLEEFISGHPELAELRDQRYVTVKVLMGEHGDANAEFFEGLPPISGVPHLLIYNARGELLCSQPTEPLEEGESYSYPRLLAFLQEWADPRRSPFDDVPIEDLRRRFSEFVFPAGDGPVLSA